MRKMSEIDNGWKVSAGASVSFETKQDLNISKIYTFLNRNGTRVSVISARHPDGLDRYVHFIELEGVPVRTSKGEVETYPDRAAAVFAAKFLSNG